MTTFTYSATTITIASAPNRPFTSPIPLVQQTGHSSAGVQYVYDRSSCITRRIALTFLRVTAAELDYLKTFLTITVAGARRRFTWTDIDSVVHQVRYAAIAYQQWTPAHFRVELQLDEII